MIIFTKRTIISFLAVTVLAFSGVILNGCGKDNGGQMNRGGGGSSGRGAVPVEALIVQPQLLQNNILTTGTMLANEEVELRSEISGRVTGVFFEEGRRVRQGERLLKINDRELQAQLTRQEVEEKQAFDDEQRKRGLYESKLISREEYDKAVSGLKMTQAQKEAIRAQLAKTEIMAPFDGIVGLRHVSEGGYVTPNVLIATMQDTDPMKVEFSVPEKHARRLTPGTKVRVQIGDSRDLYAGVVYAVESKIDPDTRTMKARATIPNPGADLIPGSFARVEITLEELPDAIVIPSGAVIPRISDEIVYVCRGGKARSISVATGIRTDSGVQIVQGLAPGDTLIVTGLLQLADGKDVEIKARTGN
jgi:membrane fusion protein (multidrug efflux system)